MEINLLPSHDGWLLYKNIPLTGKQLNKALRSMQVKKKDEKKWDRIIGRWNKYLS